MLDNKRMDIFNDNDSTYVNYFLKKKIHLMEIHF